MKSCLSILVVSCVCFSKTFNVTDYGATPADDIGNWNDGAAIQASINAAKAFSEANGNVTNEVYFPLGKYSFSNAGNGDVGGGQRGIVVPSNLILRFEKGAVVLKKESELYEVFYLNNVTNVTFINATISHSENPAPTWCAKMHGIYMRGSKNVNVIGCNFEKIRDKAVYIENTTDVISENVNVSNSNFSLIIGEAVTVATQVQNVSIVNNTISNVGGDGILILGQRCSVIRNILENIGNGGTPGSGISLGTDNSYTTNNIIEGNIIRNSYFFGIINDGSSNTIISNNTLINPSVLGTGGAIKLGGMAGGSIATKNTIMNINLNSATQSLFLLDALNCQITNNTAINNRFPLLSGQHDNDQSNVISGNAY